MKKRLREVMELIDYEDLVKMKKDLAEGGLHLGKLIEEKIKDEQRKHNVFCCVCHNAVDPFSPTNYTLLFGPDDFKKKASFCAVDCLEFFLNKLKASQKPVASVGNESQSGEAQ